MTPHAHLRNDAATPTMPTGEPRLAASGKAWGAFSLLVLMLALATKTAHAQHGPGGGGPPGGGPGGGMMGGSPAMGFTRGPAPRTERPATHTGPQLGLPGRWWDDGKAAKRIGLRTDQQRRMDEVFEANKGNLLYLLGNLQTRETQLTSLTPTELQDEAKVFAAIDRVSQARADLEKATAHTMMLIRQQMDQSQLALLDKEIATTR